MGLLEIKGLKVAVQEKEILKGVDLKIAPGEMVALLGPNGHGKSTLLASIMGNPAFQVKEGSIDYNGENVLSLSVDKRSKIGMFLAMQNPIEIAGVNYSDFLKSAMNRHLEKKLSLFQFIRQIEGAYKEMGIPFEMAQRGLNEGFSGGEKKRNEILQMKLLKPSFAMLDEIDSGLDVDAIDVVAKEICREREAGTSFLVISHYARLYDLIHPSRAVVMINGRIVTEGGPELIKRIDHEGYEWIHRELGISVEKEIDTPMSNTSIGVCATKEALDGTH